MIIEGKKAIVLVDQLYHELECWYPTLRLREAGMDVEIVGPDEGETYPSKLGYPATTDRAARDVTLDDVHCIVIPGGYAADFLRRHPEVVDLVREAVTMGTVVAVICHGGWLLTSADVVAGRRVTSFLAIKDDLVHAGAEWVDEEVVRDGNLVTSRGPDDLPAFLRTTLEAIAERSRQLV